MKCFECGEGKLQTIDSRPVRNYIRRRHKCPACGHRTTSFQFFDLTPNKRDDEHLVERLDFIRTLTTEQFGWLSKFVKTIRSGSSDQE